MPRRTHPHLSLLLATLLVALLAAPVHAQDSGDGSGEADEREQLSGRRSEVEAELDVLRRSDAELEAELARLDAEMGALEQRADEAEVELAGLQGQLTELHDVVAVAEARAAEQQRLLIERAVAAYVDPRPHLGMSLLTNAQLEDVGRWQVLLDAVVDRDRHVLDDHLSAQAEVHRVRSETEAAEGRAAELKAGAQADLAALREARERQEQVAAELDHRISDFQSEADGLAAEESRLTALLASRRAAQQAAASTTTTAAPTTTTSTTTSTTTTAPSGPGSSASTTRAPTTTTTRAPTTTTTTVTGGGTMLWPTSGVLTSTFGMRWGRMHRGIDIGAAEGTPIIAADSGTVFLAASYGDYGNLTLIDHGGGIVTAYAHQSSFAVTSGSVSRGQTIGYVGNTGRSTGPHLHFEVRVGGTAVDPMSYLG